MGKNAQKKKAAATKTTAAAAETAPAPAEQKKPVAETKPETKPETETPAAAPAAAAPAEQKPAKKAAKKASPFEAPAPVEEEWTLVKGKRRNPKKKKKADEEEKEQEQHSGQGGFGRGGQGHGRDFRNRRQHAAEEIIPIEHSTAPANVVLFVTNEEEEDSLRECLKDRPFNIVGVATLDSVAQFKDAERKGKVRVVTGVDDVRALMKELKFSVFVLPVDDERLPAPRMSDEVSKLLDVTVRAGGYALTISVTPLAAASEDNRMFFAAVPTQDSMQTLVNTLGVVQDDEVRQNFLLNGFDVPDKKGLFDIYTSLMNSAVKKYKMCSHAEVLPNGDQFVQDVAAFADKAAHYPVFTVSFKVGKLVNYQSKKSSRYIYEIHSDEIIPDTLKGIFTLLGVSIRSKLTIIVCKYQGQVTYTCEDPEKKVDVEFEKLMYSYSSLTDTPVYELYLPRYVDPTAASTAAAAASAAAAPATEEASK